MVCRDCKRVFGRTSDILYAPDGRRISGISILDTFVIHVPGVKQAQIVQDAPRPREACASCPPAMAAKRRPRGLCIAAVREIFGAAMHCDVEFVERIEPTARGKYQVLGL